MTATPTPSPTPGDRPEVLYVCVHNAGRSQMAAGWLAHLGDKAYDFAIRMNRLVNALRRAFGVSMAFCPPR